MKYITQRNLIAACIFVCALILYFLKSINIDALVCLLMGTVVISAFSSQTSWTNDSSEDENEEEGIIIMLDDGTVVTYLYDTEYIPSENDIIIFDSIRYTVQKTIFDYDNECIKIMVKKNLHNV